MKKIIFSVCIVIIIIIALIPFKPIKYAVKKENIASGEDYIIVKVQKATVLTWIAIGDKSGDYDLPKDVRIIGAEPSGYNYDLECGDNTFICYGKYTEFGHTDDAGTYDIFKADGCDILYPVKRNSPLGFIMPKSFICNMDKS